MSNSQLIKKFPSLNGLRAIAAVSVLFYHVEQYLQKKQLPNLMSLPFMKDLGDTGVTLFFVLSGFLITFLLLKEHKQNKNINIRNFYIRRVLRIWPLYFLIIILSLFYYFFFIDHSVMNQSFYDKLILYILFLPNVAYILFSSGGFPSQLWSVGVEEQFYLFWPWLAKYKIVNKIFFLILFIIFYNTIKAYLLYKSNNTLVHFKGIVVYDFLYRFMYLTRFDSMACGAVLANLYFNCGQYAPILKKLYLRKTQFIVLGLILSLMLLQPFQAYLSQTILSILFACLILNLATNPNTIFNLEKPILNYLGKISYGLYVFHPLMIIATMNLFEQINIISNSTLFHVLFMIMVISITVIVSHISYNFVEKKFLNYKTKFSIN